MALLDFGRPARRSFGSGLTPIEGLGLRLRCCRAGEATRRTTTRTIASEHRFFAGLTGEGNMMKFTLAFAAAALGVTAIAEPALAQANEQFLPSLVYRTGAYAPNGIPFADGVSDYWTLLNERDGAVFPWNFIAVGSYWTAADIAIQHIAHELGGMDKLKGKKITLVYHDSPYGKEPIAALEKRAEMNGFTFKAVPVTHPGVEQKS